MTTYDTIRADIKTRCGLQGLNVDNGDYAYWMGYVTGVWRYNVITDVEYQCLRTLIEDIFKGEV